MSQIEHLFDTITNTMSNFVWITLSLASTFVNDVMNAVLPYSWLDTLYSYNLTSDFKIEKRVTDFDKVLEFNRLFNVPQVSKKNSSTDNLKIIKNGFALITEEFEELKEALETKNKIEVKDALCDLVYVIYGLFYRMKMTHNSRLHLFTTKYAYMNIQNPTQDLYNIIEFNTLLNKYSYVMRYGNINHLMGKQVLNIEAQFNELSTDIFTVYENQNTVNHLSMYIKQLEKYIEEYDYSSTYTQMLIMLSLADLLINVYQTGSLTFDFHEAFDIVHSSNMSKICSSEEEARETVESYKLRFEAGDVPYDSPYYERITADKWMVRNRSTQKVLKNINYMPVEAFNGWVE